MTEAKEIPEPFVDEVRSIIQNEMSRIAKECVTGEKPNTDRHRDTLIGRLSVAALDYGLSFDKIETEDHNVIRVFFNNVKGIISIEFN